MLRTALAIAALIPLIWGPVAQGQGLPHEWTLNWLAQTFPLADGTQSQNLFSLQPPARPLIGKPLPKIRLHIVVGHDEGGMVIAYQHRYAAMPRTAQSRCAACASRLARWSPPTSRRTGCASRNSMSGTLTL
jgi:hypothetical protein